MKTINKNNTINLKRCSRRHKNLPNTRFCTAKELPEIQDSTVIPEENESTPTQNQTRGRNNAVQGQHNLFMVSSGAAGQCHI